GFGTAIVAMVGTNWGARQLRSGPRAVLRQPGRRPPCRGDERQCGAHVGERRRGPRCDLVARSRPRPGHRQNPVATAAKYAALLVRAVTRVKAPDTTLAMTS